MRKNIKIFLMTLLVFPYVYREEKKLEAQAKEEGLTFEEFKKKYFSY